MELTREEICSNLIKYKIPEYMHEAVLYWIWEAAIPGDFLTAVIKNDLRGAIERADDENVKVLHNYVKFFYNDSPTQCWGGPDQFKGWIEKKGWNGIQRKLGRTGYV